MTAYRKTWVYMMALPLLLFVSCEQIDDDLSDCDEEFEVNYELKLVTNLTTEIETELNLLKDQEVADALSEYLDGIFTDHAHDVDLSFYDTQADSLRLHHERHTMDDNQRSYTLHLPVNDYMHLAAANLQHNSLVGLNNDRLCHQSELLQMPLDTITCHETGLFTARTYMNVVGNADQTFFVKLYMANAAAALVVDTTGVKVSHVRSYSRGFATAFQMADSVYNYVENPPYVRAEGLVLSDTEKQMAFCTVNFPSRNPRGWWMREKEVAAGWHTDTGYRLPDAGGVKAPVSGGNTVTRVEGEIIREGDMDEGDALWEYVIFVTLEDGSITKTSLTVSEPLLAGELKIIKGRMDGRGVVHPTDMNVGMSVTLDWEKGMEYEEEL